MSYERLARIIRGSLYESLIVFALITIGFMFLEAGISRAQLFDEFTVTQSITGEVSFQTNENDVAMSTAIAGVTGGRATGTTVAVVTTNSATGYTIDIDFSDTPAMNRNGSGGADFISNYTPAGTTSPTVSFAIGGSGTAGEFGYTVAASTSYHVAPEFRGNGTTLCNTGAGGVFTVDQCWQAPSTIAREIINSTSSTPANGATTTVKFVVAVPSSPNPALPTGDYVATVTLTAATQ